MSLCFKLSKDFNKHQGFRCSNECTPMFTTALFIIATWRKWPKDLPTNEWISKLSYIYIIEYYLAIKRNEILIHATTWIDFDNIMLNEVSQI